MHLQDVCFKAADSGAAATVLCIKLSVDSCRWHASAGQSLDSIATLFGSNYVQVRVSCFVVHLKFLSPPSPLLHVHILDLFYVAKHLRNRADVGAEPGA